MQSIIFYVVSKFNLKFFSNKVFQKYKLLILKNLLFYCKSKKPIRWTFSINLYIEFHLSLAIIET